MAARVLSFFVLISSALGQVSTIGQVRQVSFDAEGLDADARDVTVVDDGNCFVYTSENIYGNTNLAGGYDDWRIWKTCGVFDGQAITHTLVSNPAVPAKMEFKYAQASGDANSACFWESEGTKDVILAAGGTFRNLTNNAGASRTPEHCDISHDGSTTVFSQKDSDGVYRVYRYDASTDASADISNPASTKAAWPRTSSNGDRTVFVSEQIVHDPRRTLSTRDVRVKDAWIHQKSTGQMAQVTSLVGKNCNRTYMYELMVADWTADALANEGITGPSNLGNGGTPCQYYAAQGVVSGAGTIDLGDNGASISGDGRFIVFGSSYDLATIKGTHAAKSAVSVRNLFLFDASLGLTWQVTAEGSTSQLEAFCCPTASSSKQRGACTKKNEMKGFCCWQRPCGHPTVAQEISTDGKSIVFWGDNFPTAGRTNTDYDVFHFHIPTSVMTSVTKTTNKNYDESYADISARGDVVAWASDYDFVKNESIMNTNQIFASKLALGCSLDPEALNYLPSPDVEVCCEFGPQTVVELGDTCHEVSLQFNGDANEMLASVPFGSNDRDGLCSRYADAVRDDVACSLAIPTGRVDVTAKSCENWGEGGIEVDVRFRSSDHAGGEAWAAQLIAQTQDSSSRVWSGYISKTLRAKAYTAKSCDPPPPITLTITSCPDGCKPATSRPPARSLLFSALPKVCPPGCQASG